MIQVLEIWQELLGDDSHDTLFKEAFVLQTASSNGFGTCCNLLDWAQGVSTQQQLWSLCHRSGFWERTVALMWRLKDASDESAIVTAQCHSVRVFRSSYGLNGFTSLTAEGGRFEDPYKNKFQVGQQKWRAGGVWSKTSQIIFTENPVVKATYFWEFCLE